MKKLLVMVLLGCMTMGLSTGCSKSEEEKAMDELSRHMIEEAAQDGVDLEKLLEEEYAAYEVRHEQNQKELQEHNEFAAVLQEAIVEMTAAYEDYRSAVTAKDIVKKAEIYNQMYDEYLELGEGDPVKERSLIDNLGRQNSRNKRNKIAQCIYELKAAYVDCEEKANYQEAWLYYNEEETSAYIAFIGKNEMNGMTDEILILKQDGTTCEIDVAGIITPTTTYIEPLSFKGNNFMINTVDNADYKYWMFDVTGTTASGVAVEYTDGDFMNHWFDNSLESLNQVEP